MECVFVLIIKAAYTQHEYSWTVKSSNANVSLLFFFCLFLDYFVICEHCSKTWLVIKLTEVLIQLTRLNPQCCGKEVSEEALGLNQILISKSILTYICQFISIAVVKVNKSPNYLDGCFFFFKL